MLCSKNLLDALGVALALALVVALIPVVLAV